MLSGFSAQRAVERHMRQETSPTAARVSGELFHHHDDYHCHDKDNYVNYTESIGQAVYECIDKITQFVSKAAIFSFLPMLTWVWWW